MEKNSNPADKSLESEYIAFISYRHKPLDKKAAERIQRSVERYVVPKELRDLAGGKKLGKVFRDEDELPASSSLSGSITYALDHSKYLIVICTPDLPKSAWCEQEIRYFTEKNGHDRVIAVLVDGEPSESFSPILLHGYDEEGNETGDLEPLAANIAGKDHTIDRRAYPKEIVRVYAALIGCPFDALWQRERRRKTTRLLAATGASALILAGFSAVVLSQSARISEQNRSLQRQLSSMKIDAGYQALGEYDVKEALRNGLDAVIPGTAGEKLTDPRTRALLAEALGGYDYWDARNELVYRQNSPIRQILPVKYKSLLVMDETGVVRCLSLETMETEWEKKISINYGSYKDCEMLLAEVYDEVIIKCSGRIIALSLDDGSEIWTYEYEGYRAYAGTGLRALSYDGKTFVILDGEQNEDQNSIITALDTKDGKVIARIDIALDGRRIVTVRTDAWFWNTASFSEDGKRLAVTVYSEKEDERITDIDDESILRCSYILIDTDSWRVINSTYRDGIGGFEDTITYGCIMDPETYDVLCAQYRAKLQAVVLSIFHWKEDRLEEKQIAKQIPSLTGDGVDDRYYDHYAVPLRVSGNRAMLACGNTLYILDRSTGERLKEFDYQDSILDAWWDDSRGQRYSVLVADGFIHKNVPGDFIMSRGYIDVPLKLSLSVFGNILNDSHDSMMLSVPREEPGTIIKTYIHLNDCIREIPRYAGGANDLPHAMMSPSGRKLVLFDYELSFDRMVTVLDPATLEVIERKTFKSFYGDPVVVDDTHFAAGLSIYGLDGSKEIFRIPEGQDPFYFDISSFENMILTNGKLLTVSHVSAGDSGMTFCWLDGEPIRIPGEAGYGQIYPSAGKNGLVAVLPTDAKESITVLNALTGELSDVEDPFPDAEERLIAIASEKQQFAVTDGTEICLIDMETGSVRKLVFGYETSEVKSLFFENSDRYLIVQTVTGKIDIWDIRTETRLFSCESSTSTVDQIYCIMVPDKEEMHLFVGYSGVPYKEWILIDTASWTELARRTGVLIYVDRCRSFLERSWSDDIQYAVQEVYSLERLTELAK